MKSQLIFAILFLFSFAPLAQAQLCGAEISNEEADYLHTNRQKMRSFDGGETRGIRDFPVKAHIVRRSNGTGGNDLNSIKNAIDNLNEVYIGANIRFVLLDEIDYINNDRFYEFDSKDEALLCDTRDFKGVINMYFTGALSMNGRRLCGYAYFPNENSYRSNKDRLIVKNSCTEGATLPHEMGHFFSLMHTQGKSLSSTDELVDGSNCHTSGDEICDTPADPGLYLKVNHDCEYTGNARDRSGKGYKPDVTNYMAYSLESCQSTMTEQQYARINYAALNMRNYMKFPEGSSKPSASTGNSGNNSSDFDPIINSAGKLSGELILELENGRKVPTQLDGNLYKAQDVYYSGTRYRLYISNDEPAYVYVIGSDLTKRSSVLFPLKHQSAHIRESKTKFALPAEDKMYMMDEVKGKDYLCVLYSKKPLNVEWIINHMETSYGSYMQRLYRALGKYMVASNSINYAEDGKLRFVADARNKVIVPIVIELRHH